MLCGRSWPQLNGSTQVSDPIREKYVAANSGRKLENIVNKRIEQAVVTNLALVGLFCINRTYF